jgi:hypothetical protein
MPPHYVLGLDLGQTQDFTALAVLERQPLSAGAAATANRDFALRHLRRFPLGTAYTEIVSAVTTLRMAGPLNGADRRSDGCWTCRRGRAPTSGRWSRARDYHRWPRRHGH